MTKPMTESEKTIHDAHKIAELIANTDVSLRGDLFWHVYTELNSKSQYATSSLFRQIAFHYGMTFAVKD